MGGVTRREFVGGTVSAAAASLAGCGSSTPLSPAAAPQAVETQLPVFTFSDAQRNALRAAVARLIPAEGAGDWSAADAGAVEYIEQLLNAFSSAGNPKIYGHGPTRDRFAEFQPLPRVKRHGWVQEVLRLRGVYTDGLDQLNRLARGTLSLLAGDFASLPTPAQDAILESLDLQNTDFFQALFAHTMEGVYGHPVYGGNRDYIAWRTFCYEGDVHGVRYPDGKNPAADDKPWDQFGGYSPDEIGKPGAACSGKTG